MQVGVRAGEVYALPRSNGVGKSTTIGCLVGVTRTDHACRLTRYALRANPIYDTADAAFWHIAEKFLSAHIAAM
jgi:ABC-type branched-subunit amino acid transport system ATPase component